MNVDHEFFTSRIGGTSSIAFFCSPKVKFPLTSTLCMGIKPISASLLHATGVDERFFLRRRVASTIATTASSAEFLVSLILRKIFTVPTVAKAGPNWPVICVGSISDAVYSAPCAHIVFMGSRGLTI